VIGPVGVGKSTLLLNLIGVDIHAGRGVVVIDPFLGVIKTNIGIKEGRIAGIGRAGNPDITAGVELTIGPSTWPVDGYGLIAEHRYTELRRAHPEIPTLREALDECFGMVVNVEIKCLPWEPDADTPDRFVVHAVTEIARGSLRIGATGVIVSSFDLGAIDACREFAPEIATGWLTSRQDISKAAPIAREHGHAWLHPDREAALRASEADIAAVRGSGLHVNVWTVDDPGEITALADAGVDAIITDVPDVARRTLRALRERRR